MVKRDQIGFGHQYFVGNGNLLDSLCLLVNLTHAMQAIDQGNQPIKAVVGCQQSVTGQGLNHRRRICQARCFDNDAVKVKHLSHSALCEEVAKCFL